MTSTALPLHLATDQDATEPGSRLEGEPPQAYAAFVVYRDLPASKRSLAQACDVMGTGKLGGNPRAKLGQLERWSATWSWVARSMQWDDHLDAIRRQVAVEDAIEMAQRHRAIARIGLNRVAEKLRSIKGEELPLGQIPAYLTACATLERLSAGLPTEIGEQLTAATPARHQAAMADPDVAEAAEDFLVKLRERSASAG